jgi:hypothetical protein
MLKAVAIGPNVPATSGKAVEANYHRLYYSSISYTCTTTSILLQTASGLLFGSSKRYEATATYLGARKAAHLP